MLMSQKVTAKISFYVDVDDGDNFNERVRRALELARGKLYRMRTSNILAELNNAMYVDYE